MTPEKASNGVRMARRTADITQEKAAKALSVSRKSITSWENGEALSMSLGTAIRMTELYGVKSVDELVGRS